MHRVIYHDTMALLSSEVMVYPLLPIDDDEVVFMMSFDSAHHLLDWVVTPPLSSSVLETAYHECIPVFLSRLKVILAYLSTTVRSSTSYYFGQFPTPQPFRHRYEAV